MVMLKKKIFVISLYLIILIRSVPHNLGKDLTKFNIKDKDISYSKAQRNLGNDNYILLYFNKDLYYNAGFGNAYRIDIDYIINVKNNNIKYAKYDPLYVYKNIGIEIHFDKAISSLNNFFYRKYDENMKYLEFIDFTNFNSKSLSDIWHMLYECSSLKSIKFTNLKTSKITHMGYMFYGCSSLESIDLSNFDTSQVTYMNSMFYGCSSLKSIDLSKIKTSKVVYMYEMFYECSSLKSIDLSNFDTSSVISMKSMFYGCSSLETIDLSNFNTFNVTDMNYMFYGCNSVKSIDLSHFDMANCYSYEDMFSEINSLKYINLYSFKNDRIISSIFNDINSTIFVCQKNKIIINSKAYNCCDSNLEPYNCISSNSENTIPSNNDESNNSETDSNNQSHNGDSNNSETDSNNQSDNDDSNANNMNSSNINIIKHKTESSSSISVGAIIGIIAGGLVVIIIAIICAYRNCDCSKNLTDNRNITINNSGTIKKIKF